MRLFIMSAIICFAATNAFADDMSVAVSQARPLSLKSTASGVFVGNAGIADVIVHDANTLIFVGKSVGTTSVLVLGNKGQTIYSGNIKVSLPETADMLTIQKGDKIQTAICQDRCVTIPSLESDGESITAATNGIRNYSTFTSGGGSGSVSFGSADGQAQGASGPMQAISNIIPGSAPKP